MEGSKRFRVFFELSAGKDGTTSAKLRLSNSTDTKIIFKFHGTALENYSVYPDKGVIKPISGCYVVITMKNKWFKDKLKTLFAFPRKSPKDRFYRLRENMVVSKATNPEVFKESGNIEDCNFKLVYLPLPQIASQVPKEEDMPVPEEASSELNPSPPALLAAPKEEMKDKDVQQQNLELEILKHKSNVNISYIASYFYYVLIWVLGNFKKIGEKIDERRWRCSKYALMIPAFWGSR